MGVFPNRSSRGGPPIATDTVMSGSASASASLTIDQLHRHQESMSA